ncbi:MAG: RNA polymerase sigma factor [Myxococcota bacterium]
MNALEQAYRTHSRRVLATLIRVLGDFDTAEEALHDAFTAAAQSWPRDGEPHNPHAWLVAVGRFKAIDRMRRKARLERVLPELVFQRELEGDSAVSHSDRGIADDELRLIFTCCHPVLSPDARIALTLREVAGLTTEEIARAFLAPVPTIAQRIVRAKAKLRDDAIPFRAPELRELESRTESVLHVIYLVFNEGYSASGGEQLVRFELSREAIRLGRLVVELLDDPEAVGLLALMLLHDARRETRATPAGEIVLLEEQDRSKWDRGQIAEGVALVERALESRRVGAYALQAAIAALHAEAPRASDTDWAQIVAFYDLLACAEPSPVVWLNRAVALGMRDGPQAGLDAVEAVLATGALDVYPFGHSARAELCRRLGRVEDARASYERALRLARQEPERRFLERSLARL